MFILLSFWMSDSFSSVRVESNVASTVASQVLGKVNGTNAYNYALELERIANNHSLSNYAFRSSGSSGANASADWIASQFQSFGLSTVKESFQFTNWDVLSKPSLIVDLDGNANTTGDQTAIESFQCEHYSWPTSSGVFKDLVILPLPPASNHLELGLNPINVTEWNAINSAGKILLVGREVRFASTWESMFVSKLTTQTPAAVVYTWWYDWMSFYPDYFSSIGGRPYSAWGPYYWNLGVPTGFIDYASGLQVRQWEASLNVSAQVRIESVVGTGPHYNVIGRLEGNKYPDKFVIVSSHYDSVVTDGFCDNGAGTAGVIELARVFSEANSTGLLRPRYTILFIAFTGEELDLVGSINYIMKHGNDMSSIVADIQLDCIGNRNLFVTQTDPGPKFDLDQQLLRAAGDLGISATVMGAGGSDQEAFRNPSWADSLYSWCWGLSAGIGYLAPVQSSSMLISRPLLYTDEWDMGVPGWIHSPYDNSTSTAAYDWVNASNLESDLKVATLSLTRIAAPLLCDVNCDGIVNMTDISQIVQHFQTTQASSNWNPDCDVTGLTPGVPDGVVNMRDIAKSVMDFYQKDL